MAKEIMGEMTGAYLIMERSQDIHLDENVVRALSMIPLWEITDPRLDKGVGDKLILRNVAMKLGLKTCSVCQNKRFSLEVA